MSPEGTIGDAFGGKYMLGHNEQIVGTCSCCGGPVVTPIAYWSVVPPVPQCRKCGARAAENYGPVIQTVPVKAWTSTSTGPVPLTYTRNDFKVDLDKLKAWTQGEWQNVEQQPGHS